MSQVPNTATSRTAPMLISFFAHSSDAELALSDLISEGVSEQDFTLLKFGENGSPKHQDALEDVIEPFGTGRAPLNDPIEGTTDHESRIGGGIETISPDDDVSSVEEMDDSESAAESLLYPVTGRSLGDEDSRDVEIGARSGFFGTTAKETNHTRHAESVLTEFTLDNIGLVLGEGGLGERLMEAIYTSGADGIDAFLDHLNSKLSHPYITLEARGALLSIDVEVTGPDSDRISDVLRERGAKYVAAIRPNWR